MSESLVGRTVMVGRRVGMVTDRDPNYYTVWYPDSESEGHLYRDEFYVLPTREEIAEAVHGQTANHAWRGAHCDKRAQRTRLREADAVLTLMMLGSL